MRRMQKVVLFKLLRLKTGSMPRLEMLVFKNNNKTAFCMPNTKILKVEACVVNLFLIRFILKTTEFYICGLFVSVQPMSICDLFSLFDNRETLLFTCEKSKETPLKF